MRSSIEYASQRHCKSRTIQVCRCAQGVMLREALQWRFRMSPHRRRLSANRVYCGSPLGLFKHLVCLLCCAVTHTALQRLWGRGDVAWNRKVRILHLALSTARSNRCPDLLSNREDIHYILSFYECLGRRSRRWRLGCLRRLTSDHLFISMPTDAPIPLDTETLTLFHSTICLASMRAKGYRCVQLGVSWSPWKWVL